MIDIYTNPKGYALPLGVDLNACSVFHVAEYLSNVPCLYEGNCSVLVKNSDGMDFVKLNKDVDAPFIEHYFPKLSQSL